MTTFSHRRLCGIILAWMGCIAPVLPQDTREGMMITVPHPLREESVAQIRQKWNQAQKSKKKIQTIVFDFNPAAQPAGTSNLGECENLADFIRSLQGKVNTVAFVHHEITKHTVLPLLACQQMIVSDEPDFETGLPKVRIGDVARASDGIITDRIRTAYVRVKKPALDPEDLFYRQIGVENLKKTGLVKETYRTRAQVVAGLGLSRSALAEDWLAGQTILPWRIDVKGPLDGGKVASIRRRIKNALGARANLLIFYLDSERGDVTHVASLAREIKDLKDQGGSNPVRTIAYIPPGKSLGASTFLALACNEIQTGKDAGLADFDYLRTQTDLLKRIEEMIIPLADAQGYNLPLLRASVNPLAPAYQAKTTTGEEKIISEKEAIQNEKFYQKTSRLGNEKELLKLTPALAKEGRFFSTTDLNTLEELYGFNEVKGDKLSISRDDALDQIAEFFRQPWVNFLLIMVGIIGMILEMKIPGTTVPGIISAICFVLFFWAHSFIGQFTTLAVLLFVLGLVLVGVEVFLLPGFGFPGLSGIILVVISLGLVTLEKWPESSQDWVDLGSTLTTFGLSLVAAFIGAFTLGYYLPSIPILNRLVLKPPTEEESEMESAAVNPPRELLGAIGTAVTPLRPAGKIQIGEEFVDVVADGDYINPGTRVRVEEIEGNRIVAKQL